MPEWIVENFSTIITIISVLVTAFSALFIWCQKNIQKKQYNLALFDKRWSMLEELKVLGYEAQTWPHASPSEIVKDPAQNFWLMKNKLDFYAEKCDVLFNKDVSNLVKECSKNFTDYHQFETTLSTFAQLHTPPYSEKEMEESQNLQKKHTELHHLLCSSFDKLWEEELKFIKNTEV